MSDKPKRALAAYMFFSKEQRPKLVAKHPDYKFTQIGSEMGRLWREMNEAGKKKYNDMAAKDKARYAKEMEAWHKKNKK